MTDGHEQAMAALGRPGAESPVPRRRAGPAWDGPAITVAVFLGVLTGLCLGYEVIDVGYRLLFAPAVLTIACCMAVRRPLLQTLVAALLGSALAGLIGLPLLLMRIVGGLWT